MKDGGKTRAVMQADQDQETMEMRRWWARATENEKLLVWTAIQKPQESPVWEIVTRFAQHAFRQKMLEDLT